MENPHQPTGNGRATSAHRQTPQSRHSRLRIPTVNEALPYTPFSSIVPFNPDLIPAPLALPSTTPTAFHNDEDVKAARRDLERLSAGARSAETASKRCQQTLEDVRRLLDPESITQFTFKATKRFLKENTTRPVPQPALSNFAAMAHEKVQVSYRYLTPESDAESNVIVNTAAHSSNKKITHQTPLQPQIAKPISPTPSQPKLAQSISNLKPAQFAPVTVLSKSSLAPSDQNGSVSSQQARFTPAQASPQAFVQPAQLTPAQRAEFQKIQISPHAYVQPPSLTPAQRSEYQNVRDLSPPQSAVLQNPAINADRRHKSEVALKELQDLLSMIFEEEDKMQPDTSEELSRYQSTLFVLREDDASSTPLLQASTQIKLEGAVSKVANFGRLDEIETGHLVRLERLCESSLNTLQSTALQLGEDWSEQGIAEWLGRISLVQSGLNASRTLMRIMTSCPNRKELQSEDYLQSILDAMRTVTEEGVMPLVQLGPFIGEKVNGEKPPRNPSFDTAADNRKALQRLVSATSKSLRLLGDFFIRTDVDESGISSVEYLCKTIIFAANARTESDSALGLQAFENMRHAAMDVLAQIFKKYISQRTSILTEILLHLEKLPSGKQSARQYAVSGAKNIQLVSALLMRLVQTSATVNAKSTELADDDEDSEAGNTDPDDADGSDGGSKSRRVRSKKRPNDLSSLYKPLLDDAQKNANTIIRMLLQRALGASKSSEEPFRKLLDIFVDDFLNVLGSPDYPAAELLLRALVSALVGTAENQKSPAPQRTMALELLGIIGSGILDLQARTAKAWPASDSDDPLIESLAEMAGQSESGSLDIRILTSASGPYRVLVEYVEARNGNNNDLQLQSALGYHLVQWADLVCTMRDDSVNAEDEGPLISSKDLQHKIRQMIEDPHWLEENAMYNELTAVKGALAGRIVASNLKLSKLFGRMFTTILASMSSEQPTVRSRSLKSVTTLLEQDPSVLDRHPRIIGDIMRCFSDPSSLVRNSALMLTQKCVALRPALELQAYARVLPKVHDTAAEVRKRAMAFLKDVYLNHHETDIRAPISNALISRIKDAEGSVAEVARSMIEEMWFTAFRNVRTDGDASVDALIQLHAHASLIIQTVELGDNVAIVLEALIRLLITNSKQAKENARILKIMVSALFDGIIDTNALPGSPSQASILRTLHVFAKTAPRVFTSTQVEHLESYVKTLNNNDDLDVYHNALAILRHALPVVSGVRQTVLQGLMSALMASITRVPKSELTVMAPCLWTICQVLGAASLRLLNMVKSAVKQMQNLRRSKSAVPPETTAKFSKLLTIIAQFGKHCDFEPSLQTIRADPDFSWFKGSSVTGMLVEVSCYFTSPLQPLAIREAAVEGISEICQTHPEHFLRTDVTNAIETVLQSQDAALERALLESLEVFFHLKDDPPETDATMPSGIEGGEQRLGGTYQDTGWDGAANSLTQRFMTPFLRIALATSDDVALTAAKIIVSINARGIGHPGESAPGLVALETCPTAAIAKLACQAHRSQYERHGGVLEKKLLKAVEQAFTYQDQVFHDTSGYTGQPPVSKLHYFWEVLNGDDSKRAKVRAKLFTQLCGALDFEPAKLKIESGLSSQLQFTRFCAENMAFFEYVEPSDLLHLLSCLEKVFAGTGTKLAQAIESEVLGLHVEVTTSRVVEIASDGGVATHQDAAVANGAIDAAQLKRLAVAAQILTLLWETRSYLRRVWNAQKYIGKARKSEKKGDKDSKETKMTGRASNAAALTEAFQNKVNKIMSVTDDEAAQRAVCTKFVELFSVDTEVKVGSDEDEDISMEDDEDVRGEGSPIKSLSGGARGKKRKSVDGGNGTPKKKRARSSKSSVSKEMDDDGDGFEGWD